MVVIAPAKHPLLLVPIVLEVVDAGGVLLGMDTLVTQVRVVLPPRLASHVHLDELLRHGELTVGVATKRTKEDSEIPRQLHELTKGHQSLIGPLGHLSYGLLVLTVESGASGVDA